MKQHSQSVIVRLDLLTKSEFSRQFHVNRKTLDMLIAEKMLDIEIICHVAFVSIKDMAVVDNALQYKSRNPQSWHKETPLRMPKKKNNESFDVRMDIEFEEFERIHNNTG